MHTFALDQIKEVSKTTVSTSLREAQKRILSESEINKFLDAVNSFKELLAQSSNSINEIVKRSEALTWLDISENREAVLEAVNELIGALLRLYEIMKQSAFRYALICSRFNIALDELGIFEMAIEDLKEVATDLDLVFFQIPADPHFQATANKLAKLS